MWGPSPGISETKLQRFAILHNFQNNEAPQIHISLRIAETDIYLGSLLDSPKPNITKGDGVVVLGEMYMVRIKGLTRENHEKVRLYN
jgi:hypothetical protein